MKQGIVDRPSLEPYVSAGHPIRAEQRSTLNPHRLYCRRDVGSLVDLRSAAERQPYSPTRQYRRQQSDRAAEVFPGIWRRISSLDPKNEPLRPASSCLPPSSQLTRSCGLRRNSRTTSANAGPLSYARSSSAIDGTHTRPEADGYFQYVVCQSPCSFFSSSEPDTSVRREFSSSSKAVSASSLIPLRI